MRYVFLVLLMTAVMVGLITWSTRPDLFEAQYDRVAKPIEDHFAEKRAAAWQAAKNQAWQQWIKRARMPKDCRQTSSALRALECKNQLELQSNAFESDWANKVASGWQPEGVN
jgi:hypothetical protein